MTLDLVDGVLQALVLDHNDAGNFWFADVTNSGSSWDFTPNTNIGNENSIRDLGVDPTTGIQYQIFGYGAVYTYPDFTSIANYSGLTYSDFDSVNIDESGRIWFTSGTTGYINSDLLSSPGSDFQTLDVQLSDTVFGEEFFFGPTPDEAAAILARENNAGSGLAGTGGDLSLGTFFATAGLFFAASAAFLYGFRRSRS